ncbi:MAG: hypothetical protein AB7H93_06415 [Vicinamibacterales bacterium]
MRVVLCFAAGMVLAAATPPAVAQSPDDRPAADGGRIVSMGQPPTVKWWGGASADTEANAVLGAIGVEKWFFNPLAGLVAARAEGVVGGGRDGAEGGLRVLAVSPLARLHAGVDYDFRDQRFDLLIGADFTVRRGGLFGYGSRLRLGWLPGRDQTLQVGLSVPIRQKAGVTRPPHDRAPLRAARPVAIRVCGDSLESRDCPLAAALREFRAAADAVSRLVMPWRPRLRGDPAVAVAPDIAAVRALGPADEVLRRMQAAWPAVFRAAAAARGADPAALEAFADQARRIVLEDVVLPFDALLGQPRTSGSLYVFAEAAADRVAAASARAGTAPAEHDAAMIAFHGVLRELDRVRANIWEVWHEDRRVFLPLQVALAPDEADSQAEIDALLERVTGDRFTEGNRVDYIVNEAFQFEVARTVNLAERYHVLWIHDVRGEATRGNVDRVSALQVRQYLEALTARVRRYDDAGSLPEYHILLDQFYYETYNGRRWMTLLERPLTHRIALPPDSRETEQGLRQAQAGLQQAVAASRRLQADRARFGEAWLHNLVKVHVSITHPADFSFWGHGLLPVIGMPDTLMRDHRKIVFYDLSEDDPTQGEALFSGMGLGEHYAGATWEDRAIVVKGPAALAAKAAARRTLERQGVSGASLPRAFHERPLAPDYAARAVAARDRLMASIIPASRVLQSHNDVGYGVKPATAAKAVLLSVMPRGSVLISPDSLWESDLWGSLLAGSALRGGRVLVIAPSTENAPGTSWLVISRMHMVMSLLLALSQGLASRIEQEGGLLKVGIFNERAAVGDMGGRIAEARANFVAAGPWFRTLLPISDATLDALQARAKELEAIYPPAYLVDGTEGLRPKLHMKGLFAVSRSAWDGVFALPEMRDVLLAYLDERSRQVSGRERDVRILPDVVWKAGRQVIAARANHLTSEDTARFVQYLQVGSSNMNDRSMLLDGEVALTVAGLGAQAGIVDFAIVCGLATWVTEQAQIDALLPVPSAFQRLIARWARSVL